MKKLSKEQVARHAELLKQIGQAQAQLEDQISILNDYITQYNDVLNEAREWAEEISSEGEEYMSDKSQKWNESEAGSNYSEWIEKYRNYSPDDLEEVDMSDTTQELFEEFEGLPPAPPETEE